MRRLSALVLTLGLLAGIFAPASAQTAAYAALFAAEASDFPQVTALLDVYDASGQFISGLTPSAVTVYENGTQLKAATLVESAPPAQITVAINPGPALAVRDAEGVARFTRVVEALGNWVNAQPAVTEDDLSLVSLSGSLINHAPATDWLVSLQSFKPDFRTTTPNLQTLAIALDTVSAQTRQPGMKRAVLFITPHMDDPDIVNGVAPFIQKAVNENIRVFVWFVDAPDFYDTLSAEAFRALALQTNGAFFTYSGRESFPDINTYFAPLRHIYTLTYTSALTEAGSHTLGVYVDTPQAVIPAPDITFTVDVQPPNVFFIAPPLQITRQPPVEDPYNPDILLPTSQPLEVIVEFPDGHIRDIERVTFYVDGAAVAENTSAPFEAFTWDLSLYTESGDHTLSVEVEDALGLKRTSAGTLVTVTVIPAPGGLEAFMARYRSYVILGAIGLAGVALMSILLFGRNARRTSTIDRVESRKRLEDPLTQPVPAITEVATKKTRTQPRKPLAPGWMQPKAPRLPEAPAYLIRLTNGGEPASVSPIPLEREMTFGTDPVQAQRVLDDPSIAPLHARIKQLEDGAFMLYDQGSVAGTWVNYDPVTREGRRLQHGDRIHFGQLAYRFDLNQAQPASEPKVLRG
jgi:hypothetical protein